LAHFLWHVVEVTGKQKKKNGQYSEGTMQWNPYGLHMFSCVTAGTIHDPAEWCLRSAIRDPAERRHNKTMNMEQHGRYPRPHALTPVCPYMEQNTQQNGIAWHLPSNFRANRATPLFILSRWSNICTQVHTLFSATCRKGGEAGTSRKSDASAAAEKTRNFSSRKTMEALRKT